jgi:hypothetical protein
MKLHAPRLRRAAGLGLALFLAACGGGGDASSEEVAAKVDNVDEESSIAATEQEIERFKAPADSVLTPQQVEAYMQTVLLQFDFLRKEAPALYERAQKMEERGKDGGVLSGFRNMAEGVGLLTQYGELVGGSFVRSARALKHNPAEMEWVRERMGEVGGYLLTKPMLEMGAQQAVAFRQQAEAMRGQPGIAEEQIQNMLQQADEMEKNAQDPDVARYILRNYEVLKRTRSNVTDPMWTAVSIAGGAQGLLGLGGLGNPNDTTAVRQMNEWRQVYTDAMANKVSPGMEAKPAEQGAN